MLITTFFSIAMCRTKTEIKQNTYNSAPTVILSDDGRKQKFYTIITKTKKIKKIKANF